jgi:hypothetical protein
LIDWDQWVSGLLEEPVDEVFLSSLTVVIDFFSLVEEEDGWVSLDFVLSGNFGIDSGINFGQLD